jgi:flagellar hook protein FlgE
MFAVILFAFAAVPWGKAQPTGGAGTVTNSLSTNILPYSPPNVRINGAGYLLVRDPSDGLLGVTRIGELNLDVNAYLVTALGRRLQGYIDPALTVMGDVQINSAGSRLPINSYQIQSNGCIVVTFADNSSLVCGQILLQNFQNPSALIPQGWQCFGWSNAAGPLAQPVPPGTSGTGWLAPGTLEPFITRVFAWKVTMMQH